LLKLTFWERPHLRPFLLRDEEQSVELLALYFELDELPVFFTEHGRVALIKDYDVGRRIFRRIQWRIRRHLPRGGPKKRGVREGEARRGDGGYSTAIEREVPVSFVLPKFDSWYPVLVPPTINVHKLGAGNRSSSHVFTFSVDDLRI
jgi:hypothetical protein